MGTIRESTPVKLFVCIQMENASLEERLASIYGPMDHRASVALVDGSVHCMFFSFERLIAIDSRAEIKRQIDSIATQFSTAVDAGYLDNRSVVDFGDWVFGKEPACQEFFLTMHRLYRAQLKSMCLLRPGLR